MFVGTYVVCWGLLVAEVFFGTYDVCIVCWGVLVAVVFVGMYVVCMMCVSCVGGPKWLRCLWVRNM